MIIILIHYRLHYISDCCTSLTWSPFTIHDMNGCSRQCCQNTHNLSVLDIMQYRAYFNELPKNAKRKWILDFIATHSSYQAASKLPDISYTICGKKVCQNVWIATLGISSSFFYCIRKKFLNGSVAIIKEPNQSPSQKTQKAIAWIQNYVDLLGDHLPHRMIVHLPSNLTKVGIYHKMVDDFQQRKQASDTVSQSNFFKIWDEHFSHVTIPKVDLAIRICIMITFGIILFIWQENRFTKCDICSVIKSEKEKTMNPNKIAELNIVLAEHLALQM